MQVAPSGGQICNLGKWRHLVAMQVAPPGGKNCNQCKLHYNLEPMLVAPLVVKFWTNTNGTTYNRPNLEPMQVEFFLAGEITQVKEAIPWVRCASGNVCLDAGKNWLKEMFYAFGLRWFGDFPQEFFFTKPEANPMGLHTSRNDRRSSATGAGSPC